MSLTAMTTHGDDNAKIPLLKTADHMAGEPEWLTSAGRSLDTILLTSPIRNEPTKKTSEWVSKCWLIITSSLHDDLLLKLTTKRGCIASLMTEIAAALLINNAEEIQPLRLELYGAGLSSRRGNMCCETPLEHVLRN